MSNAANNETIGNIIHQQIGRQAFVMMGAKNIVIVEDGLQWKLGRNGKKVTHVTVTLAADDTYTVKFSKFTPVRMNRKTGAVTGGTNKILAECDGVYFTMLRPTIERNTELRLSL